MSIWEKTLFKGRSEFNPDIRVVENSGTRKLTVNGFTQSQNIRSNASVSYPIWEKLIPLDVSLSAESRVLILGLGAGTTARLITKKFGAVTIDGVEIDPLIVEIGKKYFSLNEQNLNIIISDAADFVKQARYKYDFICVDVFKGREIPKSVYTREFFESVKNLLASDGILSINKIFSGDGEKAEFKKFIESIFQESVFETLETRGKFENMIVYAK